ncbi:SLC13 family permease [Reyranella sp.]|uniref:SLC13 family permease n=1 Tax=Reyranella sp. TaxID=1929291 RepID=UPI0037834BFE
MRKELWLLVALLAYLGARLVPAQAGLGLPALAALGVAAAGTILWITEAVALGVTALLVIVLLAITPGMTLPAALHGFTSEVAFFLIGAAAMGAAVEASGLAQRAARFLTLSARGNPTRLYAQMIVSLPALAFLVPSAITRNAILIPAYREALDGMGIDKGGRVGRALMLALGMLNPLASSALLTGGIASIAAATLLGGFSWLHWFGLMAVPYYALILLGGLYLRLMVGRFEPPVAAAAVPPAVPLSTAETRTLVVLALTAVLWLSDSWHHLSPAIPALIAAIALLCPPFGVLTWKVFEAKLSWSLILTVGASISLARAMTESGAAAWLGELLVGHLAGLSAAPLVLLALLIVAVAVVHLAITNLAACMALLIPIAITIATAAGLNPLLCGLVATLAVDAVILYPVQTVANLLAYESGYFATADVRRLGLGMLVLTIVVVMLVLPWWALLSLPLAGAS